VAGEEHKETDDVAGAARAAAAPPTDEDEDEAEGEAPTQADADPLEEGEALDPAPDRIAQLAAGCVRFIGTRYGALLDFSPDTLSFVDQWVRDARVELDRRPEVGEVVQASAGAYLGEVIRREFGGQWVVPEAEADFRLCLSAVYCSFNPLGMVREALTLTAAEGWGAHFELDPGEREAIEARLAALPHVDEDEYYAPSTRFDIICILVDALRADMEGRGLASVRFTPDDYR
jgi:hypothetical protein